MNMEEYNYDLPEELIAQTPLQKRDASKLLVYNRTTDTTEHKVFHDIIDYLNPGDCLVLNNSRVIPVRLFGAKKDTHGKVEVLLLHEENENEWEALVKPARKIKVGTEIIFGNGELVAQCVEERDEGARVLKLHYEGIFLEVLDKLGTMPLPPYIKEKLDDQERYQTVYAKEEGSAAAPTAGLHFTKSLLHGIQAKGIDIVYVTLHVGLGTFRPVTVDEVESHEMHAEYYVFSKESAAKLNDNRHKGGNIIAVGTTSTRVLETCVDEQGVFHEKSGWTDIYIYPPYTYKGIDGLITNFHLPKSTLLLLISALAGKEKMLQVYQEAIENNYRFFSFGDAMFIEPVKKKED